MSSLEVGSTLGGYRILARLRAGAMGVLYLARREGPAEFSRPVAIKVIHDHLAQNARFCRMFIDEARLSARIDHPNVVRVEEFGKADGRFYLVMEYVYGASLAQTIGVLRAAGRIPMEQAVAIAIEVAGGLHGAHEASDDDGAPLGIVHRDVSPHNILISYTGAVRVIDFGIAKARQVGGQTRTGSLRGKLAYMPPEQARSARTVDRRADLYGLGLVLWEMLTFRRVFDAETDLAIFDQIKNPVIVPPSALAPAVPKALDDIVMRTLSKDPSARPQSGLQLQRSLADALPAAQRVLSSDIAALMMSVREAASSLAEGNEDPSGLYGEEVRRTLTIFGKGMLDADEHAGDAIDTQPRHDVDRELALASVIIQTDSDPALVVEDETTLNRGVPHPRVHVDTSPITQQWTPAIPTPPPTPPPPTTSRQQATVVRDFPRPPAPSAFGPQHKVVIPFVGAFVVVLLLGMGFVIGRNDAAPVAPAPPPPQATAFATGVIVPTATPGPDFESPAQTPATIIAPPSTQAPTRPSRPDDGGARRPRAPGVPGAPGAPGAPQLPPGLPAERQ